MLVIHILKFFRAITKMLFLKPLIKIITNRWLILVFMVTTLLLIITTYIFNIKSGQFLSDASELKQRVITLQTELDKVNKKYNELKNQDQLKINQKLELEIKNISDTYKQAIKTYESITDLRDQKQDVKKLEQQFSQVLNLLSDKNYASASANLKTVDNQIKEINQKIATAQSFSKSSLQTATVSNTPPNAGFSRQSVSTPTGNFTLDLVAADLNSTKVIVDTASSGDCVNDCPVLSLADYISKNGAFAGINGSYFCPAAYPSCAGKTNSFDTLLMNKNKVYFNSANNVYSNVPAAIFSAGSARFISRSLEWGRDTGVDSVIANHPLLIHNNNVVYSGSGDSKMTGKGPRCFIANKGNIAYIGIVYGANMSDSAQALKALGMDNALNLDEGGSTALWYGGYKAGPGRNIPNAVLFVKR